MSEAKQTAMTVNPRDEWVLLQKQCKAFITSGFLPEHITKGVSAEQAMAKAITIAIKGKEIGIPPLQAFSSITVIKGKPCLSSELMLALVFQRCKGAKVTFKTPPEKQHEECTVEMQRPDGNPQLFRFTIADAKAAGLLANPGGAWGKYPAAMLRARAVSAGARAVFPDCTMGCYTPEEMGGEIIDAEVVETIAVGPAQPPPTPPAASAPSKPTGNTVSYDKRHDEKMSEPCTEAQIKMLHAVGKEHGYDHEALKELAWIDHNREHLELLTKAEVQEVKKFIEGNAR